MRITVRSISNLNLNRSPSNYSSSEKQKNLSGTLGTINSHIIVAPVHSSHCQNMTKSKNLLTNHVNLREQSADMLCRCSYGPMTYMHGRMCCTSCQSLFIPHAPCGHLEHYSPPFTSQNQLNDVKELSPILQQSSSIEDPVENQSTSYSGMILKNLFLIVFI